MNPPPLGKNFTGIIKQGLTGMEAAPGGVPEDARLALWILGLMHSGTTIVWRAWQKDQRFLCFDEPFSGLDVLPRQNSRCSYGEFIRIFKCDPKRFWEVYAPMALT